MNIVKPYRVGASRRSLAIVLPSKLVKELNIESDSFLVIERLDDSLIIRKLQIPTSNDSSKDIYDQDIHSQTQAGKSKSTSDDLYALENW